MPDPLSIGSSVVGILSITIQVAQMLDKFLKDWREVPAKVEAFKKEIGILITILMRSEQLLVQVDESSLKGPNSNNAASEDELLELDILNYLKQELYALKDALMINSDTSTGRGWKRVVTAIRSDTLRQSMEIAGRHCSRVNDLLAIQSNATIRETRGGLQQLGSQVSHWYEEAQFREVLGWISCRSFDDKFAVHLEKWCQGTGRWLLNHDDFVDWRNGVTVKENGEAVHSILWLYGIRKSSKRFWPVPCSLVFLLGHPWFLGLTFFLLSWSW